MIDKFLRWVWDSVPTHLQAQFPDKVYRIFEDAANRADRKEQER